MMLCFFFLFIYVIDQHGFFSSPFRATNKSLSIHLETKHCVSISEINPIVKSFPCYFFFIDFGRLFLIQLALWLLPLKLRFKMSLSQCNENSIVLNATHGIENFQLIISQREFQRIVVVAWGKSLRTPRTRAKLARIKQQPICKSQGNVFQNNRTHTQTVKQTSMRASATTGMKINYFNRCCL